MPGLDQAGSDAAADFRDSDLYDTTLAQAQWFRDQGATEVTVVERPALPQRNA